MNKYTFKISLNVFNHLGINLYSNVPAVLSEIVANAWDADATLVEIQINTENDKITITDNGEGMNLEDINNRFLVMGYQRRKDPERGATTKKYKRHVMGRKGIGKLAAFAIAEKVEIHSVKNKEKNGLILDSEKIKQLIGKEATDPQKIEKYHPEEIPQNKIQIAKGTKIILSHLKKGTKTTESFSRRRLARRFGVIARPFKFKVKINGSEITIKDRDYFNKLEFIWYFGDESKSFADISGNAKKKIKLDNKLKLPAPQGMSNITGWIGTFDEHKNVEVDEDYNSIVLLAHGKLIKEDILRDIKEGRIFTKYLIGEIQANFLDADNLEDIVTSDRQRISESDERWGILKAHIEKVIKDIGSKWTEYRTEGAESKARENPAINKWFESLKGDNKKAARTLFEKIEKLKFDNLDAKKELYKASILGFEKLAIQSNLSLLNQINNSSDFKLFAKLFEGVEELEATHYYYITKGRLDIIDKFITLTPNNQELVVRDFLFEHLWLLHPSWERAASDEFKEKTITTAIKKTKLSATDEKGRIDIGYRTAAGKNIIIELKKYDVSVNVFDLAKQLAKYRDTLLSVLQQKFPNDSRNVELIALLGKPPTPVKNEAQNSKILKEIDAKYIIYDDLMKETKNLYKDYLSRQSKVSQIIKLIEQI